MAELISAEQFDNRRSRLDNEFVKEAEELLEKYRNGDRTLKLLLNEQMSKHTGFRTGGPADYFITVPDTDLLKKIITLAIKKEITYYIIGNGSNMLVSDSGFRGLIIRIKSEPELDFGQKNEEGRTVVTVSAGCSLAKLATECASRGLKGLEFAAGIPGTVGGAVVMNAGAYGGEIKDCIVKAGLLDRTGNDLELDRDGLELGYRTSIIRKKNYIVINAQFALEDTDPEESRRLIAELAAKRREKQPLEYPSAGSTFKRPEGYFAGKLIEDAGLKGFCTGDAQVSEKHAGFIINKGNASSADIHALIGEVQRRVFEDSGVRLEPEVIFLGF
ncbi:MAG: UDP-N-acetylmuramate dehydrogenase [Lachnospiraceae bacterium]|nr:UDP-N-acetylmuramate dehydrogenase [Lachnospiraceae bacterium]